MVNLQRISFSLQSSTTKELTSPLFFVGEQVLRVPVQEVLQPHRARQPLQHHPLPALQRLRRPDQPHHRRVAVEVQLL